jgi:uncharacterized protein YgiM (DUF1202 family)
MIVMVISLSLNIVFAINQSAIPGSEQDPIVSKSYVDAAFEQLSSKVQTLFDELNSKIAEQDKKIKALEAEIAALKSGTAVSTTPSGSGGEQKPADQTTVKGTVNVAALNLRSQPTTSSSIIGKLYRNETVTIHSESNGWYKVTTSKGTQGYVFAIYVTKKK